MAQKKISCFTVIFLASAICMASVSADSELTKLTVYLHDVASGPDATFFPVAGIAGKEWNYTNAGTMFVTDDPMTAGPNKSSPALGRAQGIYVVTSSDGKNLLVLLSLVFTDGDFRGSTIEIQGTSKQFDPARELPVVAGTGKFRFARGFVTCGVVSYDDPSGYCVIQVNVTVQH